MMPNPRPQKSPEEKKAEMERKQKIWDNMRNEVHDFMKAIYRYHRDLWDYSHNGETLFISLIIVKDDMAFKINRAIASSTKVKSFCEHGIELIQERLHRKDNLFSQNKFDIYEQVLMEALTEEELEFVRII